MCSRSRSAVGVWPAIWADANERLDRSVGDGVEVLNAVAVGDGDLGSCLTALGSGCGELGLYRGEVSLKGIELASLAGDCFRELAFPIRKIRDASVELAQRSHWGDGRATGGFLFFHRGLDGEVSGCA